MYPALLVHATPTIHTFSQIAFLFSSPTHTQHVPPPHHRLHLPLSSLTHHLPYPACAITQHPTNSLLLTYARRYGLTRAYPKHYSLLPRPAPRVSTRLHPMAFPAPGGVALQQIGTGAKPDYYQCIPFFTRAALAAGRKLCANVEILRFQE
jgi:hypothetical protein